MNLFLDIETSGLVPKGLDWRLDFLKFPYIASIAWKIGDTRHHYIICDTTYTMPKEATAIHGITSTMVYRSEYNPLQVYELLAKDLDVADKVIGHNIYFDSSILKANARRYFGKAMLTIEIEDGLSKEKRVDTMRAGQVLTGKWPTLQELHKKLFGKQYSNPHSADTDVLAVEKCYNELKRIKIL